MGELTTEEARAALEEAIAQGKLQKIWDNKRKEWLYAYPEVIEKEVGKNFLVSKVMYKCEYGIPPCGLVFDSEDAALEHLRNVHVKH